MPGRSPLTPQPPASRARVLFENELVRVLDLRLSPGQGESMHSHPFHLVYVLSPAARMRMTSDRGKVSEVELRGGQVIWGEPLSHAGENVGTTDLHELIVELKPGASAK